MNEDNLNINIRRFLKKVGITSQRVIEKEIYNAEKNKIIRNGDIINLEMTLRIKNFDTKHLIEDIIKIE
tara:strand:+ start:97 stop:303 length:207 start_codon:yes stop_codon:yes gene_type:complete